MKIRWFEAKDLNEIQELANKHKILLPDSGVMMIAERKNGSIAGFINLRNTQTIEPLVSESQMATYYLFHNALTCAEGMGCKQVRAVVKKGDPVMDLAERVGFKEIFEDHTIIEIGIDSNNQNNFAYNYKSKLIN